jgi:hypothetical protein
MAGLRYFYELAGYFLEYYYTKYGGRPDGITQIGTHP